MKSIPRLATFLFILFFSLIAGEAQTSSGTINGRVVDRSDAVVAGAEVELTNQETGVTVTTRVLRNGNFTFADLQPGTFTVKVKAAGYKELEKVHLVLDATQNISTGTLVLEIGSTSETITVTAPVTQIQNSSSERSDVLDEKQIGNLLSYSDADGHPASQYQFWDGGGGASSAYFWTPGNSHWAAGIAIDVAAADLNNVWVQGGGATGAETMYVRAFDGIDWSAWHSYVLTTIV